jgi:hypothetical protein
MYHCCLLLATTGFPVWTEVVVVAIAVLPALVANR